MFGKIEKTAGGTWFSYSESGSPITVHTIAPGESPVAVSWKGRVDVPRLTKFFLDAIPKVLREQVQPEFTTWVLTKVGRRSAVSTVAPPFPEPFQSDAQFVRFECRPKPQTGSRARGTPSFIAWAQLGERTSTDAESVGVSFEPHDLSALSSGIAEFVAETLEKETLVKLADIQQSLTYVSKDILEAAGAN